MIQSLIKSEEIVAQESNLLGKIAELHDPNFGGSDIVIRYFVPDYYKNKAEPTLKFMLNGDHFKITLDNDTLKKLGGDKLTLDVETE